MKGKGRRDHAASSAVSLGLSWKRRVECNGHGLPQALTRRNREVKTMIPSGLTSRCAAFQKGDLPALGKRAVQGSEPQTSTGRKQQLHIVFKIDFNNELLGPHVKSI